MVGEKRREAGVLEERERAMCDGGRDGEWRRNRGGERGGWCDGEGVGEDHVRWREGACTMEESGDVVVMEEEREEGLY